MRTSLRLLLLLPLVTLLGCPTDEEVVREGLWADFDVEATELLMGRDAQVLLHFDTWGIQLGTVEALDDSRSYDPFFLEEAVTWHPMLAVELSEESSDGRMEHVVQFQDGLRALMSITEHAPGRFELRLDPMSGTDQVAFYRLWPTVDPTEGFYGLGGVLDQVSHRGLKRPVQMEADPDVESFNNEAHTAIPLVIGTTGWGIFVQSYHPMLFDLATVRDDKVELTIGTGMSSGDGLSVHLYAANHPLDITRRYYDTTGDPLLPARWGMGPWIWRDENDDEAQVRADLEIIRDLDLATTGYWIDRPYASGVNTFDFRPSGYPDPQGMIDLAHDLGFRMALWHAPYVSPEDATDLHAVAEANGYFPPQTPGTYFAWSWPIDFTNPDAYAWWQGLIRTYTDMGIEGFKLDYAEDVLLGLNGGRYRWEFWDGSDERTMHHRYQYLYHQVYAETLPEDGGFLLCRTGTWGDQVHTSVIWPGDLDATMNPHGVEANDDGEIYDATGGLPASLIVGLSLGPSGYPFYGSDTGGYRHAPPDREIFTRWFQQTALSTVMQVGTNTSDVPWEFEDDNGFDEEMLGWYREYARLHLRLWPYAWTYAKRLADDGRPIMRPYGLARPEEGIHPSDTYFFGDHLLVAPVLEYGARTREIPLPPGRWADWFTGEVLEGGASVVVDAALDRLPLLMAEGAIVPLLRPGIDTIGPTGQPDRVDSLDTDAGVLWPRVFAGPASSFELFDGAVVRQEETAAGVTVSWSDGSEFDQGAIVELVGFGLQPSSVTLDGAALAPAADLEELESSGGWLFQANAVGSVWVALPSGDHTASITR